MDIAKALKLYDQQNNSVGETLHDSVRVYRILVVTAMWKSGMPISKIDCFRELLEENALVCPTLPIMLEQKTRKEAAIRGRPISIMFDGITHVCQGNSDSGEVSH